jgi:hypothetical protein
MTNTQLLALIATLFRCFRMVSKSPQLTVVEDIEGAAIILKEATNFEIRSRAGKMALEQLHKEQSDKLTREFGLESERK